MLKNCIAGLLSVVVLLLSPVLAVPSANAEIRLAAPSIAGLVDEDGNGVYQRILKRALQGVDQEVVQSFVPFSRALYLFEKSSVDCLYSFTPVLIERYGSDRILTSFPLGKFSFFLFTLKNKEPPATIEQLQGQGVVGLLGHERYLRQILGPDVQVSWVGNEAQGVEMLKRGRVNVMIAARPDIQPHLDVLQYASYRPLLTGFDRITCHKTDKAQAFISDISRRLESLKAQGVYRELAGDRYLEF